MTSESPSSSATSSAPKPSTSRSVTTWRCVSGSSAIASRTFLDRFRRERDLLGAAAPRADGREPVAGSRRRRLHEALGIHGGPVLVVAHERGERRRARLAGATGAGEIHHDAEEVSAQGRAALERVQAPQETDPGLLGDVLGDLLGGDVLARDAHERGVVEIDEARKRGLVPRAQRGHQGQPHRPGSGLSFARASPRPSVPIGAPTLHAGRAQRNLRPRIRLSCV